MNLINRTKEGIDAGSDPVSIGVTALTDTFGGRVFEKINNESNLTGEKLNLSTGERVFGGFMDVLDGGMNFMGVHEFVKPPGVAEPPVPRRTAEPTGNDTPPPSAAAGPLCRGNETSAGRGETFRHIEGSAWNPRLHAGHGHSRWTILNDPTRTDSTLVRRGNAWTR